jgi:hypothetical protein
MRVDLSFPTQVLMVLILGGAICAYPLWKLGSADVAVAVLAGGVLSTLNVLLGYLAIEYSFNKSYSVFLKAVLGGMGARMMLMLGALLVLIKVFGFNVVGLVVSLLSFYAIFLVLEVVFIHRKLMTKNRS